MGEKCTLRRGRAAAWKNSDLERIRPDMVFILLVKLDNEEILAIRYPLAIEALTVAPEKIVVQPSCD
jgi:hypothetical protein